MARPTTAASDLLKYLLKAHPASLETRNSNGDTALMIACRFGRVDFVKILLDAGADQSVRNKSGDNIVHAALAGNPTAEELRPLLDLVDSDLLRHLLVSRSNLHDGGTTPLHVYVSRVMNNGHLRGKEDQWLPVLQLLLEHSGGG